MMKRIREGEFSLYNLGTAKPVVPFLNGENMRISSIEFWKRKDGSEAANVYALQSGYEVYMSFDLASGLPFDSSFKEGSRPYVKLKRLVDEKISFGEIRK